MRLKRSFQKKGNVSYAISCAFGTRNCAAEARACENSHAHFRLWRKSGDGPHRRSASAAPAATMPSASHALLSFGQKRAVAAFTYCPHYISFKRIKKADIFSISNLKISAFTLIMCLLVLHKKTLYFFRHFFVLSE